MRHSLFDLKVLEEETFATPTIGIGNLSLGGTGKSPFTVYLAELFMARGITVGIVSRGYKRETTGAILCSANSDAKAIGDEPKMYVDKLPGVAVVVSEKRSEGILLLESQENPPQVILLDDCYQHRKIKPTILLLLTTAQNPFWKDLLIPSGYLRDIKRAAKRKDALIITKCTSKLDESFIPTKHKDKPFFFSSISYREPFSEKTKEKVETVVSFSALANSSLFDSHLKNEFNLLKSFKFADHHYFSDEELLEIINYGTHSSKKASIITTEKDLARLSEKQKALFDKVNLYTLPISNVLAEAEKFEEFIFSRLNVS